MKRVRKNPKAVLLILSFVLFSTAKAQVVIESNQDSTEVITEDSSKNETIVIPTKAGKIEVKFTPTPGDSTEKKPEKKKEKEPVKSWSGLDLGFNGYTNSSQGISMPLGYEGFDLDIGRSYYMGLNLLERRLPIYRNHIGLISGVGMDFNNYRFRANYNPLGIPDSMGNFVTRDYTKNTLNTASITVPLLLSIDFTGKNTKGRGLNMAFGVVGGVRVASMTKEKFSDGSSRMKFKTHDDFDLNPFRVNAHARVGYKGFSLFASYALTEMFKQNAGRPELYPFTMGIAIGGN